MKLTVFLILLFCLHLSAATYAQITLSERNAPLSKIFRDIKKQSKYLFFYQDEQLVNTKNVTLSVKGASIEKVLDLCLQDQPLTYSIVGNTVVIKEKESEPVEKQTLSSIAPIDVSGRVIDTEGRPLVGVTLLVKNNIKLVTITDEKGRFVLKGVEPNSAIIIRMVGYEKKEVVAAPDLGDIRLGVSTSQLDQVQVIAYGEQSKRLQISNVSSVKAADIEKQPVTNPLLALEGRVPGLFITQSSGFAGSGVTVRIQGLNSINGGNDPLYVVDGVPFTSQLMPSISSTLGNSGGRLVNGSIAYGSPLSYINPHDIESIEVLKDADATSIYGSRAANGAILITTKKGKAGEQRVDVNMQQGLGKVASRMDLLNLRQYLDMRYEALKNDGLNLNTASSTDPRFYDLKVWDTTSTTDWQKALIGGTAHYTDMETRIYGGNANNLYTIGAGYHRETSVLPTDFSDQRASLHFQINSTSSNQKFKLRLIGNYMADVNKLPHTLGTDLTLLALQLPPNAPALYNADGSLNWAPDVNSKSTWDYPGNPVAQLLNKYSNRTNNLVSNLTLSYRVLPDLVIKSDFGYTNIMTKETVVAPWAAIAPELRSSTPRFGSYGNSTINSWIAEPQVTYEHYIGKGKLNFLAGVSIQQQYSDALSLHGSGYSSDDAIDDIHSATNITVDRNLNFTYKYAAIFGRLNYNWLNKYLVNVTARRDGSSRFGEANQFHNFGSAGVAWIFSEESFFRKLPAIISYGKLKTSYGTTGNDQIGDYQYLSTYSPVSIGVPYQNVTSLQSNGLANPYLQWEETKKINVGFELAFFKDRVLFDVDYFRNRSSNQLLGYQLPAITGFTTITRNFPATVQNSGIEISVTSVNISKKNLKWSTSINFTSPGNKLISFPGIESSSYANSLVVGQPITLVKKFHLIGVDPLNGGYYFSSATNPVNPVTPTDQTVLINTSPSFYGGVQNSISYRGFSLDFLFQFVKQRGPNYYYGHFPGYARFNQPAYVLDRWKNRGDISPHQAFDGNLSLSGQWNNAANNSDAAFDDASYIRLKNLSLAWQVPGIVFKGTGVQGLKIFLQGQNLLTFTSYKGLDPETLSVSTLPPLRVLTLGLNVAL